MEEPVILGISLGSRFLGIAVMRGGKVIDWQVKSFIDRMTPHKLHMICGSVMKVIREYSVDTIVIKQPLAVDIHDNLVALNKHLLKSFNAKGISVTSYSLAEIKARLQATICNKQELAACMVSHYPQLRFIYLKEQQLKNKYYLKIFEAVAALHVYHMEQG